MDRVCHFEIPFSEKSRVAKFYQDVFGWQINDVPGMDYSFVITTPVTATNCPSEPGGINGGMYERANQGSKTPVIVIEVASCEQRIKDVESAGGATVMAPHQVGDMGIYAQVKDTEDNTIGLWQPLKS